MLKKYLVLSLFTLVASAIAAQPSLTSGSFYSPGDFVLAYDIDATNLDDGGDGENQVWNFSGVIPTQESTIWGGEIVTPESLDDFDLYPEANVAMVMPNGIVRYWKNDASGLTAIGQGGDHELLELADGNTWLEYPFTSGSSCSDNASGMLYGTCRDYTWSSSSTTEAVGYGTLMLPSGTFDNVLKVRRVSFTSKVNEEVGLERENSIVEHFWFQAETAGPLFYMRSWSNNGCPGSNMGTEAMYAVTNDLTTNVHSTASSQVALGVFPNPASNSAQLSVRAEGSFEAQIWISDLIGQEVLSIGEEEQIVNTKLYDIDLTALQAGIYLVNVKTQNEHFTRRLVVQ